VKQFVVIGLGKFGFYLAKTLAEEGQQVICLDRDENVVNLISEYVSEAVVGDATRKEVLEGLGIPEAEKIVIATGDLAQSVLITLYLKELGAKFILAKANDEAHARILSLVGADQVIIPERDSAIREARILVTPNVVDFLPLLPDFSIAKIDPPSAFVGRSFKELHLRGKYHLFVIAIRDKRTGKLSILPPADHIIQKEEELFVLGKKEEITKLAENI